MDLPYPLGAFILTLPTVMAATVPDEVTEASALSAAVRPGEASIFACWLVQKAVGDQALATTASIDLSGHWQQLSALGDSLHACASLTGEWRRF